MKLKKLFTFAVSAALVVSALAGCGNSSTGSSDQAAEGTTAAVESSLPTVNSGVLTMATNATFPPYEYYDGSDVVGIDVDIAQAIADKLGLKLQVEDMEFDGIIAAVQTGKADMGLAGITITPERQQTVNFSDTYANGIQSVIVKEDSGIASVADLDGKKIGVQLSTTGDLFATDTYGSENVEQYNKGADAIMALTQGAVDAVIIDNEPAKSFVASSEGLQILDEEFENEEYAACISKDNEELLEAVNAALAELKEDGTIQSIIDKYITAE